jgi:hypothetical protein
MSRQPRKHFPTEQTFAKKDGELQGSLTITGLKPRQFKNCYDRLRRPKHHSGDTVLSILQNSNPDTPPEWFKMMVLEVKGDCAGIGLMVDDGRSQSLINLSSIYDHNRYGLYMLSLWIKECCKQGKSTVDAGLTPNYGTYKNQIFLDSVAKWTE